MLVFSRRMRYKATDPLFMGDCGRVRIERDRNPPLGGLGGFGRNPPSPFPTNISVELPLYATAISIGNGIRGFERYPRILFQTKISVANASKRLQSPIRKSYAASVEIRVTNIDAISAASVLDTGGICIWAAISGFCRDPYTHSSEARYRDFFKHDCDLTCC